MIRRQMRLQIRRQRGWRGHQQVSCVQHMDKALSKHRIDRYSIVHQGPKAKRVHPAAFGETIRVRFEYTRHSTDACSSEQKHQVHRWVLHCQGESITRAQAPVQQMDRHAVNTIKQFTSAERHPTINHRRVIGRNMPSLQKIQQIQFKCSGAANI